MKIKENMNNMKKYILLLAILGGGLFTSCSDWLDLRPHSALDDETAITSVKDAQIALLAAYDGLRSYGTFGRNIFIVGDAGCADVVLRTDNSNRYVNQYRWNLRPGDGPGAEIWRGLYADVINNVNEIIGRFTDIEVLPSEEAAKSQVLGECHFLRALAYYELAKLFGQPYSAGGLGVPYLKVSTMDNEHARESLTSNFENIIEDLGKALSMMNIAKRTSVTTVGSDAVNALLARVYLYMGDYAKAAQYAEAVITSGRYTLATPTEYTTTLSADKKVFTSGGLWGNKEHKESIFALPYITTERLYTNSLANIYTDKTKGYGDLVASEELVGLFTAGDVRKSMVYAYNEGTEGAPNHWCVGKFIGGGASGEFDLSFINIFRISEMYLIAAEANARTGNQTKALERINNLREQRGLDAISSIGNALINDILLERRLELCFEGHSYADAKRLGKSIVRSADAMNPENPTMGLAYPDYRFAYPIPESERNVNSLLEQNSGYSQ